MIKYEYFVEQNGAFIKSLISWNEIIQVSLLALSEKYAEVSVTRSSNKDLDGASQSDSG